MCSFCIPVMVPTSFISQSPVRVQTSFSSVRYSSKIRYAIFGMFYPLQHFSGHDLDNKTSCMLSVYSILNAVSGVVWTASYSLYTSQNFTNFNFLIYLIVVWLPFIDIFITMVTVNPWFQASGIPRYYCYVNSSDVTVSTTRDIATRRYSYQNPSPSSPELETSPDYPSESTVNRVDLDFYFFDNAFGTYACEAQRDGMTSSTSNIILLYDGTVWI